MTSTSTATSAIYFGKVPSCGDFVKTHHNHRLLATLDDWLDGSMKLLSDDPRWKITYDAANPLHFAFLGSRSRLAVAGHVVNSRDQSDRRFPFLAATTVTVERPLPFVARSPLALSRLWARMQVLAHEALIAEDCTDALRNLAEMEVPVDADANAYDPHFHDFLQIQSLGALESSLRQSGHDVSVRHLLPALGLLLQPVMNSGAAKLEKGLSLPLPDVPLHRYTVAALWLDLIAPFLTCAEFEISVFIAAIDNHASMVIGFNGAPEITLHSALDPEAGARQNININNPDWVEPRIGDDYDLQKLGTYLAQPELSLRRARETFREVFIGG